MKKEEEAKARREKLRAEQKKKREAVSGTATLLT